MKRSWLIPITIGGLLAVYSGWYLWQPGGAEVLLVVTHVLFAACVPRRAGCGCSSAQG
jgi:hypothetical protein